ncbi:heat shock protein 70, partial [Coniophora puteana RWD-64-598 SS2]
GDSAKNAFHSDPKNTVFNTKHLFRRKMDKTEVKRDIKNWRFNVINNGGKPVIFVNDKGDTHKLFTPEEISAMVLTKMKETTKAYLSYLGEKLTHAIGTGLAYVNNAQRQATKDTGIIAGLGSLLR